MSRAVALGWCLLAACGHSEPFVTDIPAAPPPAAGDDLQLTLNSDQDYWPAWTEDGRGILYAFVDPNDPRHRCIGLLAPTGGSRRWEMCHRSGGYEDSTSSFTGYALGADGRLLYAEAVSPFIATPADAQAGPHETTLWLADTTRPFRRIALLKLPINVGGAFVSWLSEFAWTGPATFIALGQSYLILGHCLATPLSRDPVCLNSDTVFAAGGNADDAGVIVRGTIAGGHATLTMVPGTSGATGYSLAEDGASIAFTRRDDSYLYEVAASGGAITTLGNVAPEGLPGYQLLGVSCRGVTCIVATDSVTLTRVEFPVRNPVIRGGIPELRAISLATGTTASIGTYASVISALAVSPSTGDVVLQVGGSWGHLQTFAGSGSSDLHLLPGIVK